MKLADDALIGIIEILRKGLTEGEDISQLLRELDLEQNGSGKLSMMTKSSGWMKTDG